MSRRKRMWIWIGVAVVVTVAVLGVVYLKPSPHAGDRTKLEVTFSATDRQRLDTVTVTAAQLAEATCANGKQCWVAVNGVVYDMSGFPAWARGRHHGVVAGTDATDKFVGAGHPKSVLEKMPVVGRYAG